MEQQKRNRSLSTQPSLTGKREPQPNRQGVEEARQLMKLRMLENAVKAVRNEPEEMPEWMEKAPIIHRRKG